MVELVYLRPLICPLACDLVLSLGIARVTLFLLGVDSGDLLTLLELFCLP